MTADDPGIRCRRRSRCATSCGVWREPGRGENEIIDSVQHSHAPKLPLQRTKVTSLFYRLYDATVTMLSTALGQPSGDLSSSTAQTRSFIRWVRLAP